MCCLVQQLHIGRSVSGIPTCVRIAGRPTVLRAHFRTTSSVSISPFLKVSRKKKETFAVGFSAIFVFVLFYFFNFARDRILFNSWNCRLFLISHQLIFLPCHVYEKFLIVKILECFFVLRVTTEPEMPFIVLISCF